MLFITGTMGSGKSSELLKVRYNYIKANKNVLVLTSGVDNRTPGKVFSRAFNAKVDAQIIGADDDVKKIVQPIITEEKIDVVLVDEVNFFTFEQVKGLKDLEYNNEGIKFILFGISKTYTNRLFPGAEAAMIYSEHIKFLKDVCRICGERKAMYNTKFEITPDNTLKIIETGDVIQPGDSEYIPLCHKCREAIRTNELTLNATSEVE